MRILSLLASGTEIVCALGAGDSLVGRSHECDNPAWVRSLPCCTEPAFDISVSSGAINAEVNRRIRSGEPLYQVHNELIRELRPDVIITQAHCEVCAVSPGDIERSGCEVFDSKIVTLNASTVDGILDSISQVAGALGLSATGMALVGEERQRLENVRTKTSGLRQPSVVMLEWTDPIFAMGNWGPELVEFAHGDLRIGGKGQYSTAIAGERVLEADPEYLIVAPCGFDLPRTLREQPVLESYTWWSQLQAVRSGKVAFADGNLFFNRSGMTISHTAEIIAEILHGVTFGTPSENKYWRWI